MQEIRNLEKKIYEFLERETKTHSYSSGLNGYINLIENYIPALIEDTLQKTIHAYAIDNKQTFSKVDKTKIFYINNIQFELNIISNLNSIIINIQSPTFETLHNSCFTYPIDGFGKIQKVNYEIHSFFKKIEVQIVETVSTIIEYVYSWLVEEINMVYAKLQDDISIDLYTLLRKLLPRGLNKNVFLFLYMDDMGFYVTDNQSRISILNEANIGKTGSQSALELNAIFLHQLVVYENSFTKEAIMLGRPFTSNLNKAKYETSGMNLAESSIYHTSELHSHCIVDKDRIKLSAGYPLSDNTKEIESILIENSKEFEKIVEKLRTKAKRVIHTLKDNRIIVGDTLGERILRFISNHFTLNINIAGIGPNIDAIIKNRLER